MDSRLLIGAGVGVVLSGVVFLSLFGSGAVFGQEAGFGPTVEAIVKTRVLGDDLVLLSEHPEKFVANDDGRAEYFELLRHRGVRLVDQAGGGLLYRDAHGRRCSGTVEQFTADLVVYRAPIGFGTR
jgi:hypothetical protein